MEILFIIIPIIAVSIFVFTFVLIISPKLRGKMISNNMKSIRYAFDESKDDISHISNEGVNIVKSIKNDNKFYKTYCKNCGSTIDEDSVFCKKCGKRQ